MKLASRIVSLFAILIALMTAVVVYSIVVSATNEDGLSFAFLVPGAVAVVLGGPLCLAAGILGTIAAIRSHRAGWIAVFLLALGVPVAVGVLIPAPILGDGVSALKLAVLWFLAFASLPVATLVYSARSPHGAVPDGSSPLILLAADVQGMGTAAPAPLDASYPAARQEAVPAPTRARSHGVSHLALAAVAAAGLVLTTCFVGTLTLTPSSPGYVALALLWGLGVLVTAGVLVWATIIALRMKRWGWAIGLVLGTLALALLTVFTLPGSLVLGFAVWGPAEAPTQRRGGAIGHERL